MYIFHNHIIIYHYLSLNLLMMHIIIYICVCIYKLIYKYINIYIYILYQWFFGGLRCHFRALGLSPIIWTLHGRVVPNSEFPRGAKDLITIGFQLVAPQKRPNLPLANFQGGRGNRCNCITPILIRDNPPEKLKCC